MRIPVATILGLLAVGARGDDVGERAARAYEIDTSGSTTALAVGERGVVAIAIRCEPGVHVQSQAPLRGTLAASAGLALTRDRLGWSDVAAPRQGSPRFEVPFTAAAQGPQEVKVHLEFFVCSRTWCVRQEREARLLVAVHGAHAAPTAPAPARIPDPGALGGRERRAPRPRGDACGPRRLSERARRPPWFGRRPSGSRGGGSCSRAGGCPGRSSR